MLLSSRNIVFIGLLVVLTFVAFSPVLKGQFFNWGDEHHGISVPLTSLSFTLENRLFGLNPFVYHLDNLLLHMGVIVLVFFFAMSLGFNALQAFLAALIFAIEPSKVESVAWIAQRKEMLYAVFYLASLISYQKGKFRSTLLFGILSMLANPMAGTLPLAMITVDWVKGRGVSAKTIMAKWPYFLMVIILGVLACLSKGQMIFSSLSQVPSILLGPFISTPFSVRGETLMAVRHFFYLPSLVLCLGLAWAIVRLYQFLKTQEAIIRHLFSVAVVILISGLLLLTFNQSRLWQNPVNVWKAQLKVSPHPFAYNQLAESLRNLMEYRQAELEYKAYNDLILQGADENKLVFNKDNFKKLQEIMDLYQKAIVLNPRYTASYYHLAQLYQDVDRFDDALLWYNKVLSMDSKNKEALFGLGLMYQRMNKPRQSIDMFNRLLQAYPENEDVYVNVVDAYNRAVVHFPNAQEYKEQREDVLSAYEQLSKRKKYSAVDYFNLGFLYEQVGGYEEAIRFYKKALEINPKYEKALYNLANRYQEMGDLKTSLIVYQKLVHDHPRYALGYLNMGVIYNALGDVTHARMYYQKTIDADPTNAGGYFNLGFLSEAKGELKEALAYYEKAVECDPLLAEGYYNIGNVYAALGQNAEAIASYLKTVSINKNHQNAFVNLSILSFKSRDFTNAVRYLEEAQLLGYTPPVEYLKSLEPYRKKK